MDTYKAKLKLGELDATIVVESTSAGAVFGKLCSKKHLDGYEVVSIYKGDHRSGTIYYDELVGLTVKFSKRPKRTKDEVVEFGFADECDN